LTQPVASGGMPSCSKEAGMAKVTGLGGVFLRARDPKQLTAWYAEHLGLAVKDWGGVVFVWDECAAPEGHGATVWSLFPTDTEYFGEGEQAAMLNFRVDDLDALVEELAAKGVWVDPKRQDEVNGRFAWIRDGEGNRVELWEPR
jgi:catechol 2,3-dioxygenase-like lactoylglutathione lyase family enzyme